MVICGRVLNFKVPGGRVCWVPSVSCALENSVWCQAHRPALHLPAKWETRCSGAAGHEHAASATAGRLLGTVSSLLRETKSVSVGLQLPAWSSTAKAFGKLMGWIVLTPFLLRKHHSLRSRLSNRQYGMNPYLTAFSLGSSTLLGTFWGDTCPLWALVSTSV